MRYLCIVSEKNTPRIAHCDQTSAPPVSNLTGPGKKEDNFWNCLPGCLLLLWLGLKIIISDLSWIFYDNSALSIKLRVSETAKMAFLIIKNPLYWFHVKSKWWKNFIISTLWTENFVIISWNWFSNFFFRLIKASFSAIQLNVLNYWPRKSPNSVTVATTFTPKWLKLIVTVFSTTSGQDFAEIWFVPIYSLVVSTFKPSMLSSTLISRKWPKPTCIVSVDLDDLVTWVS